VATNRRLRNDLLKRLGVTPQRLSQRVAQVKRLYGPMTTEEGTYLLAHQEGIDLTRYLDREMVDRIRSMLPKDGGTATLAKAVKAHRKAVRVRPVRIAPSLELVDAMLPAGVAQDANRMALIYPKLYVLENSLRKVISRMLESVHGKGWWKKCAPADVQKRVSDRQAKEGKTPWHGKRGTHEIYYSDLGDLRKLIASNWDQFTALFPSQQWITQRLDELEPPRNIVAHNNPLSKQDENRIDLYFNDWVALLNDRRHLIP
jgi:hypothetical protein